MPKAYSLILEYVDNRSADSFAVEIDLSSVAKFDDACGKGEKRVVTA